MVKIKDGFKGERSIVLPKAVVDVMASDPVLSQLYLTDIGFYPRADHHYRIRQNPINQYILIYCINGEGWIEIEGNHHIIGRDHFMIIPADTPHSYGSSEDNPWSIYWIHFTGKCASFYADTFKIPSPLYPAPDSDYVGMNSLFDRIFEILSKSISIECLRYAMGILHHYLSVLRYLALHPNNDCTSKNVIHKTKTPYNDVDLEQSVINYLSLNIERTISLKEVAKYVGIAPSSLSARFKKFTGQSPIQYFNLLKVRRACELLDQTSLSISQISMKLGISDPYYFSRLFSKTMGMSPTVYRNRIKP